jgi:hypothetical protein
MFTGFGQFNHGARVKHSQWFAGVLQYIYTWFYPYNNHWIYCVAPCGFGLPSRLLVQPFGLSSSLIYSTSEVLLLYNMLYGSPLRSTNEFLIIKWALEP